MANKSFVSGFQCQLWTSGMGCFAFCIGMIYFYKFRDLRLRLAYHNTGIRNGPLADMAGLP